MIKINLKLTALAILVMVGLSVQSNCQAITKIYFASPLFSQSEKTFNSNLAEKLRNIGYDVFLPQDSEENKSKEFNPKSIFDSDIKSLKEADLVIAILEGMEIDAGVCFEIGYAYAMGKKIYGLRTDIRGINSVIVNLMITKSCVEIFSDIENLISYLKNKNI